MKDRSIVSFVVSLHYIDFVINCKSVVTTVHSCVVTGLNFMSDIADWNGYEVVAIGDYCNV